MDIRELAMKYAAMVEAGQMDEAAATFWHDDVETFEAMPGEMSHTKGRAEGRAKAEWWYANHEVHGMESDGPYVHGDHFLIRMMIDVTPKDAERMQMTEVVQYKVADGKVVEEKYFY